MLSDSSGLVPLDAVAATGAEAAGRFPAGAASFDCPRCGQPCVERFYGPCTSCRTELVARLGGEARAVESGGYEPRMNVVPNHVATKD